MKALLVKKNKIGLSKGDKMFFRFINVIMFFVLIAVAIPIIHVIVSSISDPKAVSQGKVFLTPVGFSLEGYKAVFREPRIITGYLNTIYYTAVATVLNVVMTIMCAYPLSRSDMPGRNWIMFLFTFTMMFSGGIIPNYLLIRDLGMVNTRAVMLIPGAISVYNMIVARTYFQSNIPKELLEATKIDGGSDFVFIWHIVLPLSKAIIAVLSLYYGVAHWNAYFGAFLYLNDPSKFPLQLVLREILVVNSISANMLADGGSEGLQSDISDLLKYAVIIAACLPIWIIYPTIQKYFVKGVMVGSIKG